MEQDLISIIIPVYNVAPYITRCLESIVSQKYGNIEIIVVNDGSTDRTPAIVEQWSRKDPRIRLINQPNSGVSVARNTALNAIKGKYATFVDGDDWISPDYVSMMYDNLIRHNADIVKCGFTFIDPESGKTRCLTPRKRSMSSEMAIKAFFCGKGVTASVCGGLYRSDLFIKNNLRFTPGVTIGEDGQMTILLLLNSKRLFIMPSSLYFVRVRPQSASRSGFVLSDEYKILQKIALPETIEDKYKHAYLLRTLTSNLLKSAFMVSSEGYIELYRKVEESGYSNYNKFSNRSILPLSWHMLALIGKTKWGLFYVAKFLVLCRLKPLF